MTLDWMVLIYTVPSQPTRKRAYVWRELKRLGAVYLRDGVALLPHRPELEPRLREVDERIREYEGMSYLLLRPHFPVGADGTLIRHFQDERREEYRELHRAGVRFLRDVLADVDADDFGFPDVDKLDSELARLHRWYEQIEARDYFSAPGSEVTREVLDKCDRAFEQFASTASARQEDGRSPEDDVFERLGGPGEARETVPEDFPL
jgi:hypothetical protein